MSADASLREFSSTRACLQVRATCVGVAGVELVIPTCVLDILDSLQAQAAAGDDASLPHHDPAMSRAPDSPHGTHGTSAGPAGARPPLGDGCTVSPDVPGRRAQHGGEPEGGDEEAPQSASVAVEDGDGGVRAPGAAVGAVTGVNRGVEAGAAAVGCGAGLPEGHSSAAVHAALEEERAAVRMRTAEGVNEAAAAYSGLRGTLARYLRFAQTSLGAGAAAAAERAPVLRQLREAVAVGRAILADQRPQFESDSRCAVCCGMRMFACIPCASTVVLRHAALHYAVLALRMCVAVRCMGSSGNIDRQDPPPALGRLRPPVVPVAVALALAP